MQYKKSSRLPPEALDAFVQEMARCIREQFSNQELDFYWRYCANLRQKTRQQQRRPRHQTEQREDYDSEIKRMRPLADANNNIEHVSNLTAVLSQQWVKDKKYELLENRMNTPAEPRVNKRQLTTKQIYQVNNKMATHYKHFSKKLVRLTQIDFGGTTTLPDFPQLGRRPKRIRNNGVIRMMDAQRTRSMGNCVPPEFMTTIRSKENWFAGGNPWLGLRTSRWKD